MEIVDAFVVVVGWLLAAGAVVYGCIHIPPGAWLRWLVYGAGAVVLTQFGWLPLLPAFGFRVTVTDQYVALGLATVGLKLLMEKALPWLVRSVEEEVKHGQETIRP